MSDAPGQMRTAGLAGHWLSQSEFWLAELRGHGVSEAAINDLRQNARAAVHEAIEATEREAADALTTAQARIAELEAALALRTGADHDPDCKAHRDMSCNCGHDQARRALEAKP